MQEFPNSQQRRQWLVRNNISSPVTIGDLPKIPPILPGKRCDLLQYYTQDEASQSVNLKYCLQKNILRLQQVDDGNVVSFGSQPSQQAIQSTQQYQIMNGSNPIGPAGGDLTGFYPNPYLSDTGIVSGTYGSETQTAQILVDSSGRIISAQNVPIQSLFNTRTVTNSFNGIVNSTDNILFASGFAPLTITLPDPTTSWVLNKPITVCQTSAFDVTVSCPSFTVDGNSNVIIPSGAGSGLNRQISFISNGTEWNITSNGNQSLFGQVNVVSPNGTVYQIKQSDQYVFINTTSNGTYTANLPDPSSLQVGKKYYITALQNESVNSTVNITSSGVGFLLNGAHVTSYQIPRSGQYQNTLGVISSSLGWLFIQTPNSALGTVDSGDEIPVQIPNSVTDTFHTLYTPAVNSLLVFLNGQKMQRGYDFLFNGIKSVIFNFAPETGDRIVFNYQY